ncbi:MAG: NAD(P)/FAD-dependent oxidoreductase, partial [Candidatus Bathyarchaeia archaeon]
MKTAPEVAIIGGGPCGSFTALNLAKRGIDVAVFEEHKEVGVPCHCPGHVSIEGLRKLGLAPLPKEVVENTFRGACFHSPAGETFEVNFSSPITCTVNRTLFDKHIAGLAEEAGARFCLDSHVESLITEKGRVEGVLVKQNGKIAKVSAKIVIDAEGISSKLLKQAGLPAPNRNFIVNG